MAYFTIDKIPIRVITNDKIKVTEQLNISETNMIGSKKGANQVSAHYLYNRGYGGVKFDIAIIIMNDDYYGGEKVYTLLTKKAIAFETVTVVTESPHIPNGDYKIVTMAKEQEYKNHSKFTLSFTPVSDIKQSSLKVTTTTSKKTSTTKKNTTTKKTTKTATKKKLSSYELVVSKATLPITPKSPKKVITALQRILQKKGYYKGKIDGYWGPVTSASVKKYQTKNKKSCNLVVNGSKIDKKCRKCLLR